MDRKTRPNSVIYINDNLNVTKIANNEKNHKVPLSMTAYVKAYYVSYLLKTQYHYYLLRRKM